MDSTFTQYPLKHNIIPFQSAYEYVWFSCCQTHMFVCSPYILIIILSKHRLWSSCQTYIYIIIMICTCRMGRCLKGIQFPCVEYSLSCGWEYSDKRCHQPHAIIVVVLVSYCKRYHYEEKHHEQLLRLAESFFFFILFSIEVYNVKK